MFKSKIFNSVMRYMLVAMLALLPNAIWGENFTDLAAGYEDNNETGQSVYEADNTFHVSLTNLIYTKLKWATSNSDWDNSQLTGDCIYMRMNVVNATTGELVNISGWTISYGNLYDSKAYEDANYATSFNYNNYYYNDKYFFFLSTSNPQPIGFSGILLAKRQNSFYCTYFLHNRNVADTKSPYPIKRLEVIRWFNQKSMVFNQSLS